MRATEACVWVGRSVSLLTSALAWSTKAERSSNPTKLTSVHKDEEARSRRKRPRAHPKSKNSGLDGLLKREDRGGIGFSRNLMTALKGLTILFSVLLTLPISCCVDMALEVRRPLHNCRSFSNASG